MTDDEVVDAYLPATELGDRYGCVPCFEVHVNMWSEDFRRVARVGRQVEARGVEFNMTLDLPRLEAGLHVQIEKPMTTAVADAHAAQDASNETRCMDVGFEVIERGCTKFLQPEPD